MTVERFDGFAELLFANGIDGIHKACEVMPRMTDEDWCQFSDSIASWEEGDEPIVVCVTPDNRLLDGRHSLLACSIHGKPFTKKVIDSEPWKYVYVTHIPRRHLSVGQRAALAHAFREDADTRAKERMASGGRGGNISTPLKARDEAGAMFQVSGRSVDKFRDVIVADPELASKVQQGEVSLDKAHVNIKKSPAPITEPSGGKDHLTKNSDDESQPALIQPAPVVPTPAPVTPAPPAPVAAAPVQTAVHLSVPAPVQAPATQPPAPVDLDSALAALTSAERIAFLAKALGNASDTEQAMILKTYCETHSVAHLALSLSNSLATSMHRLLSNRLGKFIIPTAAEVDAYLREKKIAGVTGEDFINFYEAQGWRLSNGQKMTSWRGAIGRWASHQRNTQSATQDLKPINCECMPAEVNAFLAGRQMDWDKDPVVAAEYKALLAKLGYYSPSLSSGSTIRRRSGPIMG